MKKWNRTTMKWFFDNYETDIIPKLPDAFGKEDFFRTQKSLNIVSQPDRKCLVVFMIKRAAKGRYEIEERLLKTLTPERTVSIKPNHADLFVLKLSLLKGEHFCDAGIKIARKIFKALGIYDPNNNRIALFSIEQETLVWHAGSWAPLNVYLCFKHGLRTPRR